MSRNATKPVTAERIERCLDRVAEIIVGRGAEGEWLLPLYDRLEAELSELRDREDRLAAVRARITRSTDRTAGQSC